MASQLATAMSNSLKGRPVQGRIFQGKEPPQLIALFQPMAVLKGGISSGYKKFLADKGLKDDTYTADCVALIRISGTSLHNSKAVEVDAVATSLNSNECFLLQAGSSIFSWHGNQSTFEQQQLAAKVAEFLKPGVTVKHSKEGTESSTFWSALGGKQNYASKTVVQEIVRDPHLFTFSLNKGKFEVEEVYNFSQDDLLTEDMLILDTHAEVFVWVGQSVDSKEKQSAFEIGQKYIQTAASLEGLSPKVPLYRVTEGNEPCFFTTYFSWDSSKATVQGNSFQKKVSLLLGASSVENQVKSNGSNQGGPTQRASALAALSSAFNPSSATKSGSAQRPSSTGQGSQRAAAVAALSSVLTAEKHNRSPESSPARSNRSPAPSGTTSPSAGIKSEDDHNQEEDSRHVPEVKDTEGSGPFSEINGEDSVLKQETDQDENGSESGQSTFTYDQLKTKSDNPVTGIDFKRREAYLSDEEFQTVLGMTKAAFYKLPKWKQDMHKKKVDLF